MSYNQELIIKDDAADTIEDLKKLLEAERNRIRLLEAENRVLKANLEALRNQSLKSDEIRDEKKPEEPKSLKPVVQDTVTQQKTNAEETEKEIQRIQAFRASTVNISPVLDSKSEPVVEVTNSQLSAELAATSTAPPTASEERISGTGGLGGEGDPTFCGLYIWGRGGDGQVCIRFFSVMTV